MYKQLMNTPFALNIPKPKKTIFSCGPGLYILRFINNALFADHIRSYLDAHRIGNKYYYCTCVYVR